MCKNLRWLIVDLWFEIFNFLEINVVVEGLIGILCMFNNFFFLVGFECFNNVIFYICVVL